MTTGPRIANWPFGKVWPATAWFLATAVMWMATLVVWATDNNTSPVSFVSAQSANSEAGLTVVALIGVAIGLGMRFPWKITTNSQQAARYAVSTAGLAESRDTSVPDCQQLTWLLCTAAQVQVLGTISLLMPNLAGILPAVVVAGTLELLALRMAPASWRHMLVLDRHVLDTASADNSIATWDRNDESQNHEFDNGEFDNNDLDLRRRSQDSRANAAFIERD